MKASRSAAVEVTTAFDEEEPYKTAQPGRAFLPVMTLKARE
jgi:hypothetical protein